LTVQLLTIKPGRAHSRFVPVKKMATSTATTSITSVATSNSTPASPSSFGGGPGRPATPPSQTSQTPDSSLQTQPSSGHHATTPPPPSTPSAIDPLAPETSPSQIAKLWIKLKNFWSKLTGLCSACNRVSTAIGGLFAITVSIYTILNFIGQNQKHVNALADWAAMKDYSEHCVAMAEANQALSENCKTAMKPNFLPPPPTDKSSSQITGFDVKIGYMISDPEKLGSGNWVPLSGALFDIFTLWLIKWMYCSRFTVFANLPVVSVLLDYGFIPYIRAVFEMTDDDRRHILMRGPSPSPIGLLTSLLALSMAPLLFFCWYSLLILLPVSTVICLEYIAVPIDKLGNMELITLLVVVDVYFLWLSINQMRRLLRHHSLPLRPVASSRTNTGEMLRHLDIGLDKRD
jgi:hypothetical protein